MKRVTSIVIALLIGLMSWSGASATTNVTYANGGAYWSQTGYAWNIVNDAGYCWLVGWCQPHNYQWVYADKQSATHSGRWDNTDTGVATDVWVFIPNNNATAYALYRVDYNSGSIYYCGIPQASYFGTFVKCTMSGLLFNVQAVSLNNYWQGAPDWYQKMAFDEIQVRY